MLKIISGGQTGADRGGVDAAREFGTPWGGWVPKGRRAEDGRIPLEYDQFEEHPSPCYPRRTWANIRDSDATVIWCNQPLTGGSKLTAKYCRQQEKPFVILPKDPDIAFLILGGWLKRMRSVHSNSSLEVHVLNVAGSRESKRPGLQAAVKETILRLLRTQRDPEASSGASPSQAVGEVRMVRQRTAAPGSTEPTSATDPTDRTGGVCKGSLAANRTTLHFSTPIEDKCGKPRGPCYRGQGGVISIGCM